jgi:hypothetical protein
MMKMDAAVVSDPCVGRYDWFVKPFNFAFKLATGMLLTLAFVLGSSMVVMGSAPYAWAAWSYEGAVDTSWYTSSSDSYTLSTSAQLAGLSQLVDEGNTFEGKTITLSADIDISGCEWEPIGSPYDSTAFFGGVFDGKGHEITGLYINNTESTQALFGTVKGATIKNLTVRGEVTCAVDGAGIVAQATQSNLQDLTNYVNVQAIGTFSSNNTEKSYNGRAAGVVAYSIGMADEGGTYTYENLVNYGKIMATAPNGNAGVVGALMASSGTVFVLSKCVNYGDVYVSMAQNSGGLEDGVGGVLGATSSYGTYQVLNCGNEGNIFVNNNGSAGGLVGSIGGENSVVDGSYNTGSVTNMGTDFNEPTEEVPTAGGLISNFASTGGTISNNYSSGVVSSSSGYSAALVGASTEDLDAVAFNNYYVEGSSTGAFNDYQTGESWDTLLGGEAVSEEELAEKIDAETGVVAEPDLTNYTLTELTDAVEEEAADIIVPVETISSLEKALVALATLFVLVMGALYEFGLFRKRKQGGVRRAFS